MLLVILTVVPLLTGHYLLALVPVILVILLGAFLYRPDLGYYLLVAMIPFAAFRAAETPIGRVRLPWVVGGVLLLALAIRSAAARTMPASLASMPTALLALFTTIGAGSVILSPYTFPAAKALLLWVAAVAFVLITMEMLSTRGLFEVLPRVLVWSISASAFLALAGRLTGATLFLEEGRAIGGAIDANNLSLMACIAVPLLWHFLRFPSGLLQRPLVASLLLLNIGAAVASYSRSGAIVLAVTLGVLCVQALPELRAHHLGVLSVGVAALVGAAVALVPTDYWERQVSTVRSAHTDTAIQRRLSYVRVGMDAFEQRPVLGYGFGTFRNVYYESADAAMFAAHGTRKRLAHNTYLEVLVGTGLLGLAAFLAIVSHAWLALRSAHAQLQAMAQWNLASQISAYLVAYSAVLIFLLFFSNIYHKYLLLFLGLSYAAAQAARERAEDI